MIVLCALLSYIYILSFIVLGGVLFGCWFALPFFRFVSPLLVRLLCCCSVFRLFTTPQGCANIKIINNKSTPTRYKSNLTTCVVSFFLCDYVCVVCAVIIIVCFHDYRVSCFVCLLICLFCFVPPLFVRSLFLVVDFSAVHNSAKLCEQKNINNKSTPMQHRYKHKHVLLFSVVCAYACVACAVCSCLKLFLRFVWLFA